MFYPVVGRYPYLRKFSKPGPEPFTQPFVPFGRKRWKEHTRKKHWDLFNTLSESNCCYIAHLPNYRKKYDSGVCFSQSLDQCQKNGNYPLNSWVLISVGIFKSCYYWNSRSKSMLTQQSLGCMTMLTSSHQIDPQKSTAWFVSHFVIFCLVN